MNRTPVISFFNNKGGVGKTTLVYHVTWMLAELGLTVLAVDLDPQSNLTGAFLTEDRLEDLFSGPDDTVRTLFGAVRPLLDASGDIAQPQPLRESDRLGLYLLPGDLRLSQYEDPLAETWPKCLSGDLRAYKVTSAFYRVIQQASASVGADIALVDLGPNLGSINRAALVASDHVVVPIVPDLFSIQGLRNLGPTLRRWRREWQKRLDPEIVPKSLTLPGGDMRPLGYVVQQHPVRLDRPVKAFERWVDRIPTEYQEHVLHQPGGKTVSVAQDPNCLALLKNYRSLMPLAQEALKPVFFLKPADGAVGGHLAAVKDVYLDYERLSRRIAERVGIAVEGT